METKIKGVRTRMAMLRSEIATVGSPTRAATLVEDGQSFISTTKPVIANLKNQIRAEYATEFARHTGAMPPENVALIDGAREPRLALRLAGVAVGVLDVLCGGLMGAIFLNFETVPAVAIGVLLSLVICMVATAAWQGILVTDVEAPEKSIKVLRGQLKVLVPLYLGCLVGALLIGRIASSSTRAGSVAFAVSLTILAVLGPMVLAVLVRLAGLLSWAHKHATRFQQLSDLELELDDLQRACSKSAAGDPINPKPRLALAAATGVALLVCFNPHAYASECASLWLDSSLSVAHSPLEQAASSALVFLPTWVASTRCALWAFYAFGGNSFTDAPFVTVHFPTSPSGLCPERAAVRNDLNVFKGPAEANEQNWQKKCEEYRLNEASMYEQAVKARVKEIREKLAAYSPVDPERTCLVDLLDRVRDSETTRFAIVITDGVETCLPSLKGPIPAPLTHKFVVMVIILPQKIRGASSPGAYFSQRRNVWMTLAPWLNAVIPASRIGVNTFDPLSNRAAGDVIGGLANTKQP